MTNRYHPSTTYSEFIIFFTMHQVKCYYIDFGVFSININFTKILNDGMELIDIIEKRFIYIYIYI